MRALILIFMLFFAVNSIAENEGILNRLLAPGPLISGHKDLEGSDCLKCHDAGKGVPNEKCLDCHKEIRQSYNSKSGFHGLNRDTCIKCHGDHKGRDFDSTKFDIKSFSHAKTGFNLEGKHNELKCSECHLEKKKGTSAIRYFGQKSSCVSCHKNADPHLFKSEWAAKDCNACHGLKSWKQEIKFNHTTETKFKLEGKHEELKCSECHVLDKKKSISKYQWTELKQKQCLTCHTDYHKNNLSPRFRVGNCTECHNQQSWKLQKFDHKATGYPLKGKHEELKCSECHKQTPKKWIGLKSDCLSCHKDYHHFGKHKTQKHGILNKCQNCHDESSWKKTHDFNHNSQTAFPIEGKHLKLECNKCHINNKSQKSFSGIYKWKDLNTKTCEICHDNPHVKSFKAELRNKRCTECHVADGWKVYPQKVKFNHETTRFSLTGKHKELVCSACHIENKQQIFKFSSVDKKFCNDCHKTPHKDQFSAKLNEKSCSECHNTINWRDRFKFDHNETSFPLANEHLKLKCDSCHTPTNDFFNTQPPRPKSKYLFTDLKQKDCSSCHKDFHRGQLSERCSECPSDKGWKPSQFNHNMQSQFPLKAKHATTQCIECHKTIKNTFVTWKNATKPVVRFKPISTECKDCHSDPHKGNFGKSCSECHIEKEWKITKDFHKNFTLRGVHFTAECAECHKNNRRLSGLSEQCQTCHQKDDIHNGTLPNCGDCHKQQFWENADFKHSMSNFALRGMHRTLECSSCHIRGIYTGTSNRCVDCHLSDAQGVAAHPNPLPTFENCTRCHNQFSFK